MPPEPATVPDASQEQKQPIDAMVKLEADASFTTASGFALLQRGATLLANSTLVPNEYRNSIPNCTIALNMAQRIGADPLMVMQNLYIVHGRPGWSAQFLIATFNQCGRFSAIRYEWEGEPGTDGRGCRAWAIEKETGAKLTGALITIALAKAENWFQKNGSKWQTMPEQMTMYRAAAWFVRAYAPEIAMGLHTVDEIEDAVIDVPGHLERIVVTPPTLGAPGAVTAKAVAAGVVSGQDQGDEPTPATKPQPPTIVAPSLFHLADPVGGHAGATAPAAPVTDPKAIGDAVKARLKDIETEVGLRGVKDTIVDHLMKKHVGATLKTMDTVEWDDQTFVKLGKMLTDVRSLPAVTKK